MNAGASVASEDWEKLLSEIRETGWRRVSEIPKQCRRGVVYVNLTDLEEDEYDFANEVLMRTMRESLLREIRIAATFGAHWFHLRFRNKFFMTMNEQQQRSFFHSMSIILFRVSGTTRIDIYVGEATDNSTESLAITISTSALLKTLPLLHIFVEHLGISNVALTHQSDVQEMSNIIRAKSQTLRVLVLESIKCPVDDCIKQDSDEPNGFFDPLLRAASGLDEFSLSAKTCTVHSTLVSPMAVRALFVRGGKNVTLRSLRGLGLTDSHVLAIVDGLSMTRVKHLNYLDLDSNPGITAQGYDALFNLIDRANVIGYYEISGKWSGFRVDDKAWEVELNLVSEMNSRYGRLEYLMNGSFSSEERRWQWLERVVDLPSNLDRGKPIKLRIDDAKRVNFIWCMLRENPEMMRT